MKKSTQPAKSSRTLLQMEALEARCLLSAGGPSPEAQQFLQLLNQARANPAAFGQMIGVDLSGVAPAQPLAFNQQLINAALGHSQDMSTQGYFDHNTPQGVTPGQRISAAGFDWDSWGESIAGGSQYPGAGSALTALLVDLGIPDLGHRRQLLAIDAIYQNQNEVGIGVLQNSSGPLVNYYTIDSAAPSNPQRFITGVVMADANGNGQYDIGEGLGNAVITVQGVGAYPTWDSGGFSIPIGPGTYTLTASGGGLAAPITRVVSVGAQNVQVNFVATPGSHPGNSPFVSKIYQTVLGRAPSAGDVNFWNGLLQSGVSTGFIAQQIEASPEAEGRTVANWYRTYLGRSPGNAETQWWIGQLSSGTTEEAVMAQILGSDEFINQASSSDATGSTPDQSFIVDLYSQVLNRKPSPAEQAYWLGALVLHSHTDVASDVVQSAEARGLAVTGYYSSILGRKTAPTAGEVDFWVNSVLSLEEIRIQFEGSAEYLGS
jgi:uncharacterized protein YkwD